MSLDPPDLREDRHLHRDRGELKLAGQHTQRLNGPLDQYARAALANVYERSPERLRRGRVVFIEGGPDDLDVTAQRIARSCATLHVECSYQNPAGYGIARRG